MPCKGLTFHHTILTFNDTEEAFWKHGGRRKCWKPVFSPFPTMFPTLPISNFNFSFTFILSSANAFNMDQSKILLFGKGLITLTIPLSPVMKAFFKCSGAPVGLGGALFSTDECSEPIGGSLEGRRGRGRGGPEKCYFNVIIQQKRFLKNYC